MSPGMVTPSKIQHWGTGWEMKKGWSAGCSGGRAWGSDAALNTSEGERCSTKCSLFQHQIEIMT